jgi:hypothetical protein
MNFLLSNKVNKANMSQIALLSLAMTNTLLAGCDSDNNAAELARAVELEKLRANGTIIESVTIENAHIRLRSGQTHQLSATGIDSKDETREVTNELTWISSDASIATVNSKGLVTAVANSDVNQGIVTITGTTINDVFDEGEISVSDVAVSEITLKQASPDTDYIQTCIAASIKSDVSYEDGYLSLNTVKDMTFTLDDQTTALISEDGTLYTSAESVENTTITATIGNIDAQLTVMADPKDLENIDILLADEIVTGITLNIGERIQVNAQASLLQAVSQETFNIDPSITWQQDDTSYAGMTHTGVNKGSLLALNAGVTELSATCGGKSEKIILEVKGDAQLQSTQITDSDDAIVDDVISIEPLGSIELTLTANYDIAPTSLNVSEFADWNIIGNDIVEVELTSAGLNSAHYKVTSTSRSEGSVVLLVTYGGIPSRLRIDIEK